MLMTLGTTADSLRAAQQYYTCSLDLQQQHSQQCKHIPVYEVCITFGTYPLRV